jgi:acetyl-CoA synthetase
VAPGFSANSALQEELRPLLRLRLVAHLYPREIVFVESLSLTGSGKVQRRIVRERERRVADEAGTI